MKFKTNNFENVIEAEDLQVIMFFYRKSYMVILLTDGQFVKRTNIDPEFLESVCDINLLVLPSYNFPNMNGFSYKI